MTEITQTTRLALRHLRLSDAAFITTLVNDSAWLRFIGDKSIGSIEDAERYLENGPLTMYAEHGFGLFAVVLRDTDALIGLCGLLRRDGLERPDLGFAFLPEYRRNGFATEAAKATLVYAQLVHGLTHVDAITLPENEKSIALLRRLKFDYQQDVQLPGDSDIVQRYTVKL
ncbi:MAG: GNAT family N-acetyltransferase [Pseudomonadota bacterium]